MKKFIIFFAALAAVLSCTKENPVDNYNPADDTYSVTLTASAPGADTKTTLVDGGVDGEGKPIRFVHWSKGDAIKVLFFPGRHGNEITGPSGEFVSHFEEDASASANFRIDKWSFGMDQSLADDRLYSKGIAVYPSSANASSTKASGSGTYNVSDVSFTLPSEQKAIENNIESNLNFSYADVDFASFTNTINNPSHQTKLQFKNVCALIQLTMPAQMPQVTEIVLTSNDKVALTGHGSMNYTNKYNQEVNGTVTVTDGANVVLKNADGFKAGAAYYAVVWPGVHNSGLTIEFMAEDGTVATKTTPAVTLTASNVKPYTFNKGLDFIAPVQDFNYIYADGTTGNELRLDISGVIIYNGDPHVFDPNLPETCKNGLCLKIGEYEAAWISSTSNITSNDLASVGINNISGSTGGYTARQNWLNFSYNKGVTFPMYTVVNQLESPSGSSGWYIGTNVEWEYIWENYEKINNLLTGCNGSKLLEYGKEYWTAVSLSKYSSYIVKYADGGGIEYKGVTPIYVKPIRPILAF